MLYFPVKSLLNSANLSGISSYKIRKNNPLHFQHLRNALVSADSKGTSTPLDSAVTRPLPLTPLESTLTKNRGRGWGGNYGLHERNTRQAPLLFTLASLSRSPAKEQTVSPFFPIGSALFNQNSRGVPKLFQIWNATRFIGQQPLPRVFRIAACA